MGIRLDLEDTDADTWCHRLSEIEFLSSSSPVPQSEEEEVVEASVEERCGIDNPCL